MNLKRKGLQKGRWEVVENKGKTTLRALQTKDADLAGWFGRARLRLNFMGNITIKVAAVSSIFVDC